MIDDDKPLQEIEDFSQVKRDLSRPLSLSSLNMSTHSQDGDIEDFKDPSIVKCKIWLSSIQVLQDLLISYQKKFKEYQGQSEYLDCGIIRVSSHQSWKCLSPSEIEVALPILTDSFMKLLKDIYNQTRSMDSAVMRVRNRLAEVEKVTAESNKQRKRSAERPFQTMGGEKSKCDKMKFENIQELESRFEGLEKKCKRLENRIAELKKESEDNKKDMNEAEDKYKASMKENKKLKREIKDLKEGNDPNNVEEIINLKKKVKDLQRDLKMKEVEVKEEKEALQKNISKGLESKLDHLLAVRVEKELSADSDGVEDFKKLKTQVKDLQKELKMKEAEMKVERERLQKESTDKLDKLLAASLEKDSNEKNDKEMKALNDQLKQLKGLKEESLKKDYLINSLKGQLKTSEEEISAKNSTIKNLTSQVEKLNDENSAKNSEMNALHKEIEQLRLAARLNEESSSKNENMMIGALNDQIDMLQKRIFSHDKELADQKTCYQCKESDLVKSVNEVKEQSEQHSIGKHNHEDIINPYYSMKAEAMETEHQNLNSLPRTRDQDRCDDGESSEKQLLDKIAELEHLLNKKTEAITILRDKLTPYLEEKARFEEDKIFLEERHEELEGEIKNLKEENEKKTEAITKMRDKLMPYLEEKARFEEDKKNFEERHEELEGEIKKLKEEIKNLKEENEKKVRAMTNMKQKIKILNSLGNTAEELQEVKGQYDHAKIQIKDLEAKIITLKSDLRENMVERENLKKDKIRMDTEMENMKKLNFMKKTGGNK